MSGFDGEYTAVAQYRRTLHSVAENQVVDAAEGVLAQAWLAHLSELRRCAIDLAEATHSVHEEALARLRIACSAQDPAGIADAQEFVERVEADLGGDLAASRRLLTSVEEHVALVSRAGYERLQRKQADLERLRAAWSAAYGETSASG
jgi:hypothetical protein